MRGGGKAIIEHSPVGSSRSNGIAERAIQGVQGMIRTLRRALESRLGVGLGADHVAWAWMADYAAQLITRFEVGHAGRTTYERAKAVLMEEARMAY